jgi:PIN domain nuclease of toxin-antitoxin system
MHRPVLLDTCAAIWLMNGDPMSTQSRAAIRAAQARNLGVCVSPITAWEIATLVAKERLRMTLSPLAWFEALLALPGLRLVDMPPELLIASVTLPGAAPRDPADRIIAATARALGCVLITRDGELIPYAGSGHIEAVAC